MFRNLSSLAIQGMLRKKRSSILIFSVLLISFSFAIVSLSLVDSIRQTNAEFRLNAYGEWYFALPSGMEEDAAWLDDQSWAEKVGVSESYGTIDTPVGQAGFGTMDPAMLQVGRITLDAGLFPSEDNEIAMEADVLDALGYSHDLGQEITLWVNFLYQNEETTQYMTVEKNFRLCGIIHEYSDLWVLNRNSNRRLPISAVVTDDTAQAMLETAKSYIAEPQDRELIITIPQYFITVGESDRDIARASIKDWLASTRTGGVGDTQACENTVAYPGMEAEEADRFYVYAVAAVTMVAVLCVYVMQMSREVHSFAVLRSIGITKLQMALLLLMETLFLILPTILLGIPCGAGLTWLALRLMLYTGSVPIQVSIPYDAMLTAIGLWVAAVLLSRLIMFAVTVHTSLTGRMQLKGTNSRWVVRLRSAFVILLLSTFGTVAVYTAMESMRPSYLREYWSLCPSYTIWGNGTVSKTRAELIRKVPGVARVDGFGEMQIALSYDGMDEQIVWIYAIDEEGWTETFDFCGIKDEFHNGELVLLCFPEETDEPYILPQGPITLRVYNASDEPIAQATTEAVITEIPEHIMNRTISALQIPYTVVCSETYVRNLLASMESGQIWDKYVVGEEFGYDRILVSVDLNANYLSTDMVMANFCKENGLSFDNRRQEFQIRVQEHTQTLILLYSACICIAVVVLLILIGALTLETEHEKQYWGILRAIGLSKGHMWCRILGKAFLRSLIAVVVGWMLYGGYAVIKAMENHPSLADAIVSVLSTWKSYDSGMQRILLTSAICLFVPLTISLLAKRKSGKGDMLS